MKAYAVGIIASTQFGDDIVDYLRSIDDTLAPFEGGYRMHGGPYDVLEGEWTSDLVVIEFPSMEMASGWYNSAAYGAIRELRQANTTGTVFLVNGVADTHRGSDLL